MKKLCLGIAAAMAALASFQPASASTLLLGGYPDKLMVFDESKGEVTQRIHLKSGLPTNLSLSNDKKLLYITTNTQSGIEVIDVATRKVVNSFSLNTPFTRYRFRGGVADPTGRYFYTIGQQFDKQIDHYEVKDPQFLVIDLKQHKVVRTADIDKQDEDFENGWRIGFMMSRDGKSLYLFHDKVLIMDTASLKAVDRIELGKAEGTGMVSGDLGGQLDRLQQTGQYVSLFTAEDPYIHNKTFGIARFTLDSHEFDFTPIGPAPEAMAGLEVTPDGKDAYTVVVNGKLGSKRCEFWHFDTATNAVLNKKEFQCRSRFYFGMSGDGTKLYIYGAGFEIEVYDAKTLDYEHTWDLGEDITMAGIIAID